MCGYVSACIQVCVCTWLCVAVGMCAYVSVSERLSSGGAAMCPPERRQSTVKAFMLSRAVDACLVAGLWLWVAGLSLKSPPFQWCELGFHDYLGSRLLSR